MLKRGRHDSTVENILVVDDEEPIRALLANFLQRQGYKVDMAADGEQALESLAQKSFDLVLSDVRMPRMDGIRLLSEISARYPDTAVLMLTGVEDVSVAVNTMKGGALDYVLKPFHLEDVGASVKKALEKRKESISRTRRMRQMENTIQEQTSELRRILAHVNEASEFTLEALVAALDAREHETQAHSKRVSEYTVHLARKMGVEPPLLEVIRRGAMLHDIGKIGISDNILLKPSRLTEVEWSQMRKHPEIGYWILQGVEPLRSASSIVLSHHERFDGSGYPRGLKGDAIPLGARIFSVADSLDAMISDRPYHKGGTYEAARAEIVRNSGTQFDPEVVKVFLSVPPEDWPEIRRRSLQDKPRTLPEITPLVLT